MSQGTVGSKINRRVTRSAMAGTRRSTAVGWSRRAGTIKVRIYRMDVFLIAGPMSDQFIKKNRVVFRTILIRGDQTLSDLHRAIFKAYNRWEEHCYEFQFGKRPMDPNGPRYVLPITYEVSMQEGERVAGRVDWTTIDSLKLKVGHRFGYWFDFGDDWWHQINVEAIQETKPKGRYPRVIKRIGRSPPQYPPLGQE